MKHVTRYTYLNLRTRPDRRLLAAATAARDGIPKQIVDFWDAGWFETLDELGHHAVENGFDHFKGCIGQNKPIANTAIGQNYNIMRYLTDRVERDTLEVFLHDDVYFSHLLGNGAHQRLTSVCEYIQRFSELNILLLDPTSCHLTQLGTRPEPEIFKDNYGILKGIKGSCDFARVYSQKGAQLMLDRMLSMPYWRGTEVLFTYDGWTPPGVFTTIFPFAHRYPNSIVGSDTFYDPLKKG